MCSVSISEQEASQIDIITATIVSTIVARIVRASEILAIKVADGYDYTHNLKT
jgi:hypothetical protein